MVVPPVMLVPFQFVEISSAIGRASALRPALTRAEVAKEREDAEMCLRRGNRDRDMMVVVWRKE